jgi:hypothetical protein
VYLENNDIFLDTYPITENEFPLTGNYPGAGGSRITARFNHVTDWNGMTVFSYHGTETSGRSRTGRQMEVYGNNVHCEGNGGCSSIAGVRGGVEYLFGNTMTIDPGQWINSFGGLQTQRTFRNTGWYLCNGLTPYDVNDGYTAVWTGKLAALSGSTVTLSGTALSAGAFNFSSSAPGPKYYVVFDSTAGWIGGIASNTSSTLTTSFLQEAGAGSGTDYAMSGDTITIYSTMLYAAGTHTGSTSDNLTDGSKSWAANHWGPVNGHAYNVVNLTQNQGGYSWQIGSSTSNTAVQNEMPYPYWQWNTGDVYIITGTTRCLDQGSAYGGQLFNASPFNTGSLPPANPVVATTQTSDPSYEFNDVGTLTHESFGADSLTVIANRDYFSDGGNPSEWKTPGTALNTGVASGTLANRPTTCASGVAYWAYDQGSWNQSGNSFGQGVLYTCAPGNQWQAHYTPYTYPHPLTQGPPGTNPGGAPAAPTNLQALVI